MKTSTVNRLSTLGLWLATLLVSPAVPVSLQTLPSGTVTLKTSAAIATTSLLDTTGSLGPSNDRTLSSGRTMRMALHSFAGHSGQTVSMTLTSQDFDTVVVLADGSTSEVVETNYDANSKNSGLQVTLPSTGSYYVGVASPSSQATGNYRLVVTARN
ncbi:MAG: hypothetical protein WBG32_08800 [Nodosilinea sp.]